MLVASNQGEKGFSPESVPIMGDSVAAGKRGQPQTSHCLGTCYSQPGGVMLLGRSSRLH